LFQFEITFSSDLGYLRRSWLF